MDGNSDISTILNSKYDVNNKDTDYTNIDDPKMFIGIEKNCW